MCLLLLIAAVNSISHAESLPYISPDGINAILSDTVEFRCIVPSDTDQIGWFINGTLFTEDVLANRGITINKLSLIRKTNASFALLSIQARAVNNNTTLQCRIVTSSDQVARSEEVLLQIQGPLAPPTSLETTHFNSTHDLLVWEDPYTLDLTDIDPDITGYTITITMENPPPLHPYNHSLTLDELDDTRTESFTISSSDGPQFPFPRYAFPMWLRGSVENPAGLGEMSEDLKYSIQPQTDCTRISDLPITSSSENKVVFNDSTPSVEIFLFQIPSQSNGNYCLDTVEVVIDASYEEISPLALVPTLSGTGISVILESGLEEDTSYTATLFSNSTLITTTNFTTFAVQNISLSVVSNELTVQCQFAEGCTHDMCTVVLLINGEKYRMENSTGEITFSDLLNGTYTVLVYDSGPEMTGGSGDLEVPAIERTVTISGAASPSPSADMPSATDLVTPSPTDITPTIERGPSRSRVGGYALWITVVVVTLVVMIIAVAFVVMVVRRLRRRYRSSVYRVSDEEAKVKRSSQRISASNPIPEVPVSANGYAEIPEHGLAMAHSPTPRNPSSSAGGSPGGNGAPPRIDPYETVDLKEDKKKIKEEDKAAPSQASPAEHEEEEFRKHTYSVVNKDRSKKKKKAEGQDSSPPPLPPQNFDYKEEFQAAIQVPAPNTTAPTSQPSPQQASGVHVYDTIPTTKDSSHQNKVATDSKVDPMYDTLGDSSPNRSSSNPSLTDEREDSRLLQSPPVQSPPALPPRTTTMETKAPPPVTPTSGDMEESVDDQYPLDLKTGTILPQINSPLKQL